MNYFQLFEIPITLQVDAAALKKKFYELSRKYHPDFYSQATEDEQDEALEKSSILNKAFKTFSNKDETIKYVLKEKGLLQEEEKYQLSPDFLMEMMELNEAVMDAKMEGDTAKEMQVHTSIQKLENELYAPVKTIVEDYKEGITTKEELLQVKEYYYRKKYLQRILAGSH